MNTFAHRLLLLTTLLAPAARAGDAPAADTSQEGGTEVRGVNPADNLTKLEILPRFTVISDATGATLDNLTLKYDRAIQGIWGVQGELPVAYFSSPGGTDAGLGDLSLRGRYQFKIGFVPVVTGVELVVPTASATTLGTGKWLVDPVVAVVVPFSAQTFLALVGKGYFSLAGSSSRADVSQGQLRAIVAHTTAAAWWYLADLQLWVDFEQGNRVDFAPEVEVGRMVAPLVGVWLRAGGHVAGDWTRADAVVSGGIRFISF